MVSLRAPLAERPAGGLRVRDGGRPWGSREGGGWRTVVAGIGGLLCGLRVLAAAPGAAVDTNAVLQAWFAAQAGVETWSAAFVQTRTLKALVQPLVATGQVWFARPNRFRWELGRPVQTLASRDEDQLQVLYPRLRRAERYRLGPGRNGLLGEALGLLDAGFPRDRTDFEARFRLLSLEATHGAWRLDLQPASPAVRRVMPGIRLVLRAEDFDLLAQEVAFPDGSRLRNDFSGGVRNAPVPPSWFRPPIDPEYTVIEP